MANTTNTQTFFQKDLAGAFKAIPDFPKKGILFRHIGPLLADPKLWKRTVQNIAEYFRPLGITKVVGMDARGFLIGIAVAMELGAGFVMARKPSKLPGEKWSVSYGLEYGDDRLEMLKEELQSSDRVLIADDLLATGGTADAAGKLVKLCGASVIGYTFIVELNGLGGREKLSKAGCSTSPLVYACCSFD